MNNRHFPKELLLLIVTALTLVVFVAGWVFFNLTTLTSTSYSGPEHPSVTSSDIVKFEETDEQTDQRHMVLDCSGSGKCQMQVLEKRYTFSPNPGIGAGGAGCSLEAYRLAEPKICENLTEDGVEEITMIADNANYIDLPFYGKEDYNAKLINYALVEPWDIEFLPDGRAMVTERTSGKIKLFNLDLSIATTVGEVDTIARVENGLLGLAIDPKFFINRYVYTYHTYKITVETDNPYDLRLIAQVTRWIFDGNTLKKDIVIVDNIPTSIWHAGGRLEFGPDDYLYITTGDAGEDIKSQDYGFLGGKVLRVTRDGEPAPGNPNESFVYSRGHRNPQGLAWTADGKLFVSEHGDFRYDEINMIDEPGQNNGWGVFWCDKQPSIWSGRRALNETSSPEICYDYYTMAPSGMEIIKDPASPWNGNLFIAGLRGRHLQIVPLDGNSVSGKGNIFFVTENGDRLRDVEYYSGALYILGDYNGVWRLDLK